MSNNNNNIVDFSLYQHRNRAKQAADLWNELLELELDDAMDVEFLWLPFEEPANDNFEENFFKTLLENFLPETREDYETFFGNTYKDYTIEIWFNPETGEFEDSSLSH